MARQKKESVILNARLDAEVVGYLNDYCKAVGATKTAVLEEALRSYIGERTKVTEAVSELSTNELKALSVIFEKVRSGNNDIASILQAELDKR